MDQAKALVPATFKSTLNAYLNRGNSNSIVDTVITHEMTAFSPVTSHLSTLTLALNMHIPSNNNTVNHKIKSLNYTITLFNTQTHKHYQHKRPLYNENNGALGPPAK